MMEWDPGPPPFLSTIFAQAPFAAYRTNPQRFRLPWGPIYYRGRLDGTAKVLVIGQDPAADENVARRILVGDAGRRVQGLLTKLGLTRSYVMVNASLYSLVGQFDHEIQAFMDLSEVQAWRHQLLDALVRPAIEAIVAFGRAARHAVETWPGATPLLEQGRGFFLTHPTARPVSTIFQNWNAQLPGMAAVITPDPDGMVDVTPYTGSAFDDHHLAPIPRHDLPFGVPAWMGTGDTAVRLQAGQPFPPQAQDHPAILWVAIGDQG
jgi:uracil-DNA glycosylase